MISLKDVNTDPDLHQLPTQKSFHSNPRTASHRSKQRDEVKDIKKKLKKLEGDMKEERSNFAKALSEKDAELAMLKDELFRSKTNKIDYDTLTTNNDPISLKQEVEDLHLMIEEMEQERDDARDQVRNLQKELVKTQEIIHQNQLNLIDPLQNKIQQLEKIVDEKEADIKKRYKRKLRKYKREIEVQARIIDQLKSKVSKHQSKRREESSLGKMYNIETSSYGDENEDINIGLNRTKKYTLEQENKRYSNSNFEKMRKSKSKTKLNSHAATQNATGYLSEVKSFLAPG